MGPKEKLMESTHSCGTSAFSRSQAWERETKQKNTNTHKKDIYCEATVPD